jgi:hypothetical protein
LDSNEFLSKSRQARLLIVSGLIFEVFWPKDLLIFDYRGFSYINPSMFHVAFVQDVDPIESDVMAIDQNTVA